jgi:hypothetical protein
MHMLYLADNPEVTYTIRVFRVSIMFVELSSKNNSTTNVFWSIINGCRLLSRSLNVIGRWPTVKNWLWRSVTADIDSWQVKRHFSDSVVNNNIISFWSAFVTESDHDKRASLNEMARFACYTQHFIRLIRCVNIGHLYRRLNFEFLSNTNAARSRKYAILTYLSLFIF